MMAVETVVAEVWQAAVPADILIDRCYTWETGQVYANEGYRVVAVADDRHVTKAEAQALYDNERRNAIDCFGKEWAK